MRTVETVPAKAHRWFTGLKPGVNDKNSAHEGELMKRIVLVVAGIIVALVLIVLVIGLLTPQEHHATRAVNINQPPQMIWDTINDHANEQKWRDDISNVTAAGERNGKPIWQENYKDGNTVQLLTTESTPPTRIVREIAEEGPFSGRWEIDIKPSGNGSTVRVTEIGKVPNPFFRFVSKYIIGHTTFMERYLKNLAVKFGDKPEVVP